MVDGLLAAASETEAANLLDAVAVRDDCLDVQVEHEVERALDNEEDPGDSHLNFEEHNLALVEKVDSCHAEWERGEPEQVLHPGVDLGAYDGTEDNRQCDTGRDEEDEGHDHGDE